MSAKYTRIKEHLISQIQSGSLQAGMKVPSENQLSDMFGVHHSTAQKALRELVADGYVEARRGSGSYVRETSRPKSGNIAMIVNSVDGEFYGSLTYAAQSVIASTKRHMLSFATRESFEAERRFIEELVARQKVDGLLIVPSLEVDDAVRTDYYRSLRRRNIPFVLIFPPTDQPDCHCVHSDDEGGAEAAVRFLIEQGHTRIGFVGHELPGNLVQQRRLAGFRHALGEHGLPFDERYLVRIPYPSFQHGRLAAEQVAGLAPRPTAFFVVADLLVIGMLSYFTDAGLRVPADIALVGCGNGQLSSSENYALTTLDNGLAEVANAAVKLLDQDVINGTTPARSVVVGQKLVVRKTA